MTEPEPPSAHRATGSDLERAVLGAAPDLTAQEVATAAGITVGEAQRLWRALGFPDAGEQSAFTQADVQALADAALVAERGDFDHDTIVKMTRAVGQLMSRLAEWEVGLLTAPVETMSAGSRTDRALELVQTVGRPFESLLVYAWRRHLAAAVARVEVLDTTEEEGLHIAQATVGFADLVSFSELTNTLDDDEIGDLVEVFESRAHDVVAERGGRVVKTLGDSVLFLADAPEDAIDTALDIIAVIGGDVRLPDVRLGLATGPVVLRMGDVYGPAVNFDTRVLPARPVRGFGEVEPVAVRRTRSRHAF
jgi:adenylate cyclase